MTLLRSPKNKLLLAAAAIVLLALLAPSQGASASSIARVLLGACAVAGLGAWFLRARARSATGPAAAFAPAARLRVLSRTGLSQRCGMALVEADGRNYLVVFGDGFAELQEASAAGTREPGAGRGKRGVR
jgi:flagellar protein FliO/FliZ